MPDGYFEYKLDGARKISVQSLSSYRYTEDEYSRLSFDRIRLESVRPFPVLQVNYVKRSSFALQI